MPFRTSIPSAVILVATFELLLSSLAAFGASCVTQPPGLVAWWRAENNALDAMGQNPGTLVNGVGFLPGYVGTAFNFQYISGQRVDVTNSPSLDITGPITVEAWILLRDNIQQYPIVEKYAATNGGFGLRVNGGKLMFFTTDSCCTADSVTGATTLATNTWYHVAGEWNGSALLVYVNGALDGSFATTKNPKAGAPLLRIGARGDDAYELFNGLIDEASIYNRALSASEISSVYYAGTAGKCLNPAEPFLSFNGANGASPYAGLVQDTNGVLWGATYGGGTNGGFGTIFKVTTNGIVASPYSFTGGNDGAHPNTPLALAADGNFYGTTVEGGTNGSGTIFKITPAGMLTTLYSFSGGTDGQYPEAGLIQSKNGNFYGTTEAGGTNGSGTIFQMTRAGAFTSLYSCLGNQDTQQPYQPAAALLEGMDGNLYGTTIFGGTNDYGTIFRITTNGVMTRLYSFTGGGDGGNTWASLIQGVDGSFYGTTPELSLTNFGTVFKFTPTGVFTTLYTFTGGTDGGDPFAALVQGRDANFYGTAAVGGARNNGTLFKIVSDGTFNALYSFLGSTDGESPSGALLQATDGNFYGTAVGGGSSGDGTVFRASFPGASFPPNDNFSNAVVIAGTSNTVTGANVGATKEPGEPNHAGDPGGTSVWWTWTAPTNGYIEFDTYGSSFDTLLGIYTGGSVSALAPVASNDNSSGGLQSQAVFLVSAGTNYKIAVDGRGATTGSIALHWQPVAPPNDNFSNAFPILDGNMVFASNIGATLEPGESNRVGSGWDASVWWRWTAPVNGVVNVLVSNVPPYDSTVLLVIGTGTAASNFVELQSDSNGAGYPFIGMNVSASTTYYIGVYTFGAHTLACCERDFSLSLSECPAPQILDITTTQSTQTNGIHVVMCADIGNGTPTSYEWTLDSNPVTNTPTSCVEFVFPPTDDGTHIVNFIARNGCGFDGQNPPIVTCGICLSVGTPNLLTGTTGSGSGLVTNTSGCGMLSANARWYKMVLTNGSGMVTVSTENSGIKTIVGVFTGSLLSPTAYACSSNLPSLNQQSRVTFQAIQGVVYWIAVDPGTNSVSNLHLATGFEPKIASYGMGADGSFQLQTTPAPPISYALLSTTNISLNVSNWSTALITNLTTNFPYLYYRETNAENQPQRFYRLAPEP